MTKHISIVNVKIVAFSAMFLFFNLSVLITIITTIPSYLVCIVPAIVMVLVCLINFAITNSFANSGIDVRDGTVFLQENSHGKPSTFHRNDLKEITLEDGSRNKITENQKYYKNVKIVFHLKSGRTKQYYALSLTQKQFEKVKKELL